MSVVIYIEKPCYTKSRALEEKSIIKWLQLEDASEVVISCNPTAVKIDGKNIRCASWFRAALEEFVEVNRFYTFDVRDLSDDYDEQEYLQEQIYQASEAWIDGDSGCLVLDGVEQVACL